MTQDQILARFLIKENELSKEEAKTHYSQNVLEQYIGCRDLMPTLKTISQQSLQNPHLNECVNHLYTDFRF